MEQLIENAKPPARAPAALDYLLSTPLRYPPLKRGSRFGTTLEMGIWYGAEEPRTAFAEVAYYLVVLLEGTAADIQPLQRTVTAFTSDVKSTVAVDLTLPPFATHGADISAKDSYVSSQQLGLDMRAAGTTAFRFTSARDIRGGVNVGVFSPSAFASKKSKSHQRWLCVATTARVEFTRQGVVKTAVHSFPRADFLIGEALPTPAI